MDRDYTVNGLNQYVSAGPASFTYDANGNLTSDGVNSYLYDVENRLVTISGAKNANLVYDPLGRLHAVLAGNGTVTRFQVCLWRNRHCLATLKSVAPYGPPD